MSVRVTAVEGKVALYDSVTGLAFGPVLDDDDEASAFIDHLELIGERDPRVIPAGELAELLDEWRKEQA